ncbi:MAG: RNA polymerase sigma-70 factor (TIGR02943 family) [Parvicella sp.]|jgi:RNA polymerase sigma-70 factor (TIGR02943 family)
MDEKRPSIDVTTLVEDFGDDLYRFAYSKTQDKMISEDLVQETFIVAIQKSDKFRGESAPKTWLTSILKNKIADFYRKKKKEGIVGEDIEDLTLSFTDNGHWSPTSNSNPFEFEGPLLNNQEFTDVFYSCIDNLPDLWRSVIKMKYVNPQKSNEICKELEITDTNLWQIVHRSKLKLRSCIDSNWFNHKN